MSLQKGCALHIALDQESYNPATRRFTDKSAYGNHGTSAVAAVFAGDRMGQLTRAGAFAGVSDCVIISDDNSLSPPSTLSVFAWVKGDEQLGKTVVSHYDNPQNQIGYQLLSGSSGYLGKMRVIISDNGTYTVGHRKDYRSSLTAFDDTWHCVGITFAAGVLKLYVDGVEDVNPNKSHDDAITSIHDSTADIAVGSAFSNGSPAGFFTGSIADARIYNRVLTQSEITYLYESYRPKVVV